MGRKSLYSKQEFMRVYKKAKSTKELANLLDIAVCTAYTYIIRYKVRPYPSPTNEKLNPVKVGTGYAFNVTIDDIARKLQVSWSSIHQCLRKLVLYPEKYTLTPKKKDRLPPPKTIPEIKIINLIRDNGKFIDNPWLMTELPGITENLVDGYYRHAFGYRLKEYEKGEG